MAEDTDKIVAAALEIPEVQEVPAVVVLEEELLIQVPGGL